MGSAGKDEVQTCVKPEICHSGSELKCAKMSSPSNVCDERLTITISSLRKEMWAFPNAFEYGVRRMWSVMVELIEEISGEVIESRDIYAGYEVIQVFAGPIEFKMSEGGKDRACRRGQTSALPKADVGGGFECNVIEFKVKSFKAGQCGKACGHRLG